MNAPNNAFGQMMRSWRERRRLSQLELAMRAQVSSRHLSFLETGRSRPSRDMVLRIASELDVPLAERNAWLVAAGHAPVFERRAADDGATEAARLAVDWMVDRHDPYPALAIDRHWRLMRLNETAEGLLSIFGLAIGDSLLDAMTSEAMAGVLLNRLDVLEHARRRLGEQLSYYGEDAVLSAALGRIDAVLEAAAPGDARDAVAQLGPFVTARYALGDTELALLTTLTHFQGAQDIALSELRVELMFPADEASRKFLEGRS
ncbi:MAG: helix-turn-helix domain-containing protein [Pseudomonadota bacterium]